jgi:hypothetical protein
MADEIPFVHLLGIPMARKIVEVSSYFVVYCLPFSPHDSTFPFSLLFTTVVDAFFSACDALENKSVNLWLNISHVHVITLFTYKFLCKRKWNI